MKRLFVMLAILSVATLATAQQMSIMGTVTDAVTGDPIANARVNAMHAGMTYTNEYGEYTLNPMRPGAFIVTASAEGYEPGSYPDTVYVEQGQTVEGIDIELDPAGPPPERGAISGTVTDAETGDPIEGARVHTMHRLEAFTNGDGYYIIENVPAGDYLVRAGAEGYEMAIYPDTVTVVEGETTEGIDFELVPCVQPGTGAISGTVTDERTGEPIEGARVHTFHQGEAYTNEDGYYIIENLPAGEYIVTANAMGYQGETYPDTVVVVEDETTENIDFELGGCMPRYGAISGAVTDDETGEIIRGAVVTASSDGYTRQVTQGCRGYSIGMLPAGMYHVSAEAPGYEPGAYPDSVEVVVGEHVDGIDIALVPGSGGGHGGIAGEVTNAETGDPIVGAHVVAMGAGRTNTDPDGEYLLENLAPGTYAVKAMMRGFEPSAPETVEVVAGEITGDVDFELVPMGGGRDVGAIAGTVTDDETGEPIFNAHVFFRSGHGQGMAYTDSSGNYLIEHVPAGAYIVRASARQYYPGVYPESVVVVVGETTEDIDFALEACPRLQTGIAGFVIDGITQGELAGATVKAIGTEETYETETDANGEYLFAGLEPGDYRIEVSIAGYETGMYRELVIADPDEVEGLTAPWIYPLTGIEESPAPGRAARAEMTVGPNPFTTSAMVRWQVPVAGHVSLKVVDNTGRVVTVLQDGYLEAGRYSATWNGTNGDGRRLAHGIYFYHLDAPGVGGIEKVVLLGK